MPSQGGAEGGRLLIFPNEISHVRVSVGVVGCEVDFLAALVKPVLELQRVVAFFFAVLSQSVTVGEEGYSFLKPACFRVGNDVEVLVELFMQLTLEVELCKGTIFTILKVTCC
jgi:hypothetical protein